MAPFPSGVPRAPPTGPPYRATGSPVFRCGAAGRSGSRKGWLASGSGLALAWLWLSGWLAFRISAGFGLIGLDWLWLGFGWI